MKQSDPNLQRLEDTSPAAGRDSAAAAFEAVAAPDALVDPGAPVDIVVLVEPGALVDIAAVAGFQGRAASGQEPK